MSAEQIIAVAALVAAALSFLDEKRSPVWVRAAVALLAVLAVLALFG